MGIRKVLKRYEEWMEDDIAILEFLKVSIGMIATFFFLLFVFIALPIAYLDSQEPHFILNKNEFNCTAEHTEMAPVVIGKIVTEQPRQICDQYTRK